MGINGKHLLALLLGLALSTSVWAGAQRYEPLSASAQAKLSRAIADRPVDDAFFATRPEAQEWLEEMSDRLSRRLPDAEYREDFLKTLYYEASRAGLDPEMLLGLIEVESGFRKYALSTAGARGFMQIMPFWVDLIGAPEHNLFHLRTNLRYGCIILRHYLDIEKGDLYRALGRYNGSLGRAEYPNMVLAAWKKRWSFNAGAIGSQALARAGKPGA
jgi:soluble lytic murein transglycosylase-like protein